ncbi:hypothetical protein [Phocicoccus pinnipedialis]|uniref:DUF4129 domain-containing protein n=1 Tax=Phocicoccus pinnipedialis TaxID=110845 RepID=A0A6V7RJ54_9BACL|nr:hypothetical protein [Jeotgalicoccus pinnipedialis]MBP1938976.1 hypothetical protein [Jeotgalicoccus pinnipedialis]CAD2077329.1 hypothetical protein JEOPIN946_01462 [Jeotgalicoccus pinnipedialis]
MIRLFKEVFPKYVIEMMTVIVILAELNATFNETPKLLFNSIVLILVFLIGTIITNKARSYVLYYFVPFFFILFLLVGNNVLVAMLYSVISVFRFDRLYMDRMTDFQKYAIVVSLIVVILSQFIRTGIISPDNYMFYSSMFIVQLISYFILKIVAQMTDDNIKVSDYLNTIIFVGLILTAGGAVVGILFKGISSLVKLALVGILNAIFFLMKPLFVWMDKLEFETPEFVEEENTGESLDETVLDLIHNTKQESLLERLPLDMIIIGIIVVAFIIMVIVLVMRSKNDAVIENEKLDIKIVPIPINKIRERIKLKKPKDPIRQVYFDFERWVNRIGIGRYTDETIEEWIAREELSDVFSTEEIEIYSKVRYGSHSFTDVSIFKAHINAIKNKIKAKIKEREN